MAVTQIRGSSQIISESILAAQLASDSVITVKILNKNVTEPKLADKAVSTRALGDNVVTEAQIAAGTITTASISGTAGITLGQLAKGADIILRDGSVAMTDELHMGGFGITNLATIVKGTTPDANASTVKYVNDEIQAVKDAAAAGMIYRGALDASATFASQAPAGALSVGDFFMVTVAGDLGGFYHNAQPLIELQIGDMLVVNKVVASAAAAVVGDFDRIDNTDTVTSVCGRFGIITLTASDLTDVTASAAEINKLVGIGSTTVISQLDAKLDDSQLDTDALMAANSDAKIPSQKAVKTYVDNATTVAVGLFMIGEVPSGAVNGTNAAFTVASAPKTGSLAVYLNGMRLQQGGTNDYTWTSGVTFTMLQVPQTGDILLVDYRYNVA